jgi:DnaJ-class molecular chaperone
MSEAIRQGSMRLRSEHHPDRGGDPAKFQEIQNAYEEAMK